MGLLRSDRTSIYGIDSTRLLRSQNGPRASPNAKSGLASLGEAEALPRPARPVPLRVHACFQLRPDQPSPQSQSFPKVKVPACRLPALPPLFYWPEAAHLGDLLRFWVRPEATVYTRPPDFQLPAKHRTLLQMQRSPIQSVSGKPAPYKEKTTLPGAPASVWGLHSFAARGGELRLPVREYWPGSLSTRGSTPARGRPAPPLRVELP